MITGEQLLECVVEDPFRLQVVGNGQPLALYPHYSIDYIGSGVMLVNINTHLSDQ